jgi:hypothetical protein|nr:MAG TPA: hypothetical protein [Caudoviricetes sp.]
MFIKEVKELFKNMNELEFKIRLNKLYKLVGITRLFLDGVEVITDCVNETTEYNFATQQYDIFIEYFKDKVIRIFNILVYHNKETDLYELIVISDISLMNEKYIVTSDEIQNIMNKIYIDINNVIMNYLIERGCLVNE